MAVITCLDRALWWDARGVGIIPLRPSLSPDRKGKLAPQPWIRWRQDGPLRGEAAILEFWATHPDAQLGIYLDRSRCCTVDVDRKHLREGLAPEGRPLPSLPRTYAETTKGGGFHLVFRFRDALPEGVATRSTGLGGYLDVFMGGLVVVAPSRFANAERPYEITQDLDLQEFATLQEGLEAASSWIWSELQRRWRDPEGQDGARPTRPPADPLPVLPLGPPDASMVARALKFIRDDPDLNVLWEDGLRYGSGEVDRSATEFRLARWAKWKGFAVEVVRDLVYRCRHTKTPHDRRGDRYFLQEVWARIRPPKLPKPPPVPDTFSLNHLFQMGYWTPILKTYDHLRPVFLPNHGPRSAQASYVWIPKSQADLDRYKAQAAKVVADLKAEGLDPSNGVRLEHAAAIRHHRASIEAQAFVVFRDGATARDVGPMGEPQVCGLPLYHKPRSSGHRADVKNERWNLDQSLAGSDRFYSRPVPFYLYVLRVPRAHALRQRDDVRDSLKAVKDSWEFASEEFWAPKRRELQEAGFGGHGILWPLPAENVVLVFTDAPPGDFIRGPGGLQFDNGRPRWTHVQTLLPPEKPTDVGRWMDSIETKIMSYLSEADTVWWDDFLKVRAAGQRVVYQFYRPFGGAREPWGRSPVEKPEALESRCVVGEHVHHEDVGPMIGRIYADNRTGRDRPLREDLFPDLIAAYVSELLGRLPEAVVRQAVQAMPLTRRAEVKRLLPAFVTAWLVPDQGRIPDAAA